MQIVQKMKQESQISNVDNEEEEVLVNQDTLGFGEDIVPIDDDLGVTENVESSESIEAQRDTEEKNLGNTNLPLGQ